MNISHKQKYKWRPDGERVHLVENSQYRGTNHIWRLCFHAAITLRRQPEGTLTETEQPWERPPERFL